VARSRRADEDCDLVVESGEDGRGDRSNARARVVRKTMRRGRRLGRCDAR